MASKKPWDKPQQHYNDSSTPQVLVSTCPQCHTPGIVKLRQGKLSPLRWCPRCNVEWAVVAKTSAQIGLPL